MENYLVTGGAGFIGSAIVKNLVSKGKSVTVLDDFSRGSTRRLEKIKDKINFINLDIRDAEKVIKVFKKNDFKGVIHLAYINGTESFYTKPQDVLEVAISGIQNVISGMRFARISEFYLASSSEVYQNPGIFPTPEEITLVVPDPSNPRYSYGLGKIIQEFMTLNFIKDINKIVVFRPHNIYGPDMGFGHVIPELFLRTSEPTLKFIDLKGNGKQRRSFCYIDDFISAFEILLNEKTVGGTYNIGSNSELEIVELAKLISKLYDRNFKFNFLQAPLGETSRRLPDLSKLKNLGYEPKFSIKHGIELYKKWFDLEGNDNARR
jgi:nucleoside-diphosphate-sugar epimerase